jgi:K+-transporting ATPase ATPase B chain
MIALVEGAERQKTPNEIALNILLAGLTIAFLLAVVTLQPFAIYAGAPQTVFVLVSLLVCLIPTTIGGLLSAIGIAGMDRLVQHNVLAMSGRAVEAAGDVNTLLLDKTGTITLGNREATEFVTAPGVSEATLADSAQLSSLADETPEGRSLVVLAKEKYGLRGREMSSHDAEFIPFSAMTRMSGVNLDGRAVRKGATDAIAKYLEDQGSALPTEVRAAVEAISRSGGTPLVVAENGRALGVIHLKDIVKGGMRQRFDQPRYGDQDLDDYGRQSADGRRDRNRSWSRRFSGPGHAERQARSDSKGTGTRKAGRHDRRRHERRFGVGASRCRGRHEHRHTGSKGSRQHGGPGFESD